jgi:hypothetical protein
VVGRQNSQTNPTSREATILAKMIIDVKNLFILSVRLVSHIDIDQINLHPLEGTLRNNWHQRRTCPIWAHLKAYPTPFSLTLERCLLMEWNVLFTPA